jgi:cyanate permease
MTMDNNKAGWIMLGLIFCLYASFGIVNRGLAPLITAIMTDLKISYCEMGVILGTWQMIYIPVALFAGALIDRLGVKITLFIGVLIIGLSSVLRYFASGFGSLLFAVSLFGIGGPMISIGGPKIIAIWFVGKKRGTAMSIFLTGNILGGLVSLLGTNSIIMPLTGNCWRLTFVCYGLVPMITALIWRLFAVDSPSAPVSADDDLKAVFISIFRNTNVRLILVMGLCAFAIGHGFSSWLPKILESSGLSPKMAGYAASVPLFFSIPSILIVPRMVPEAYRSRFLGVASLITAFHLIIATYASGLIMLMALTILGLSSSCLMPVLMLILIDSTGIETTHLGAAGGVFFCVAEIGGVIGPAIIGVLVDLTHSFMAGSIFLAGLSVFICILAMKLSLNLNAPTIRIAGALDKLFRQ